MTRLLALACLLLTLGAVHAVPARPLYEPVVQPKPSPPAVFAGSHWTGKCYSDNFWIIFETNGSLTYGYNDNKFQNGTWALQGENLYFEMNNRYLEFRGTMIGGTIQGEAWNVVGSRFATSFKRSEKQ